MRDLCASPRAPRSRNALELVVESRGPTRSPRAIRAWSSVPTRSFAGCVQFTKCPQHHRARLLKTMCFAARAQERKTMQTRATRARAGSLLLPSSTPRPRPPTRFFTSKTAGSAAGSWSRNDRTRGTDDLATRRGLRRGVGRRRAPRTRRVTDLSARPSPPTWRGDGRRGVAAFKSIPCGK